MAQQSPTSAERAAWRAQLRRRYRRRRLTALAVVVGGLVAVGALLGGFVFNGSPVRASQQLGASTVCEPTEPAETVKPSWLTAHRRTMLVDSVLLGGKAALKERFKRWKLRFVGEAAVTLPAMEERIAAKRRVARLVVLGIGYNSIWERRRRNYRSWARKFDTEARRLLATLRRKGAQQFVWVTLRDTRRAVVPPAARWQHDRYAWYHPYVNERLRRLDRTRDDLVLAPWHEVSDRTGLTYDAIHLNPEGAALMARTIQTAFRAEGERQTTVIPPGGC